MKYYDFTSESVPIKVSIFQTKELLYENGNNMF